jgi:hypothetical protein
MDGTSEVCPGGLADVAIVKTCRIDKRVSEKEIKK